MPVSALSRVKENWESVFQQQEKKQVVKFNRTTHEYPVELIRQGKHYMKVRNRKEIAFTVFYPGFPLSILALGTMTVTAGVITDANMPAMIAPVNMTAQRGATATL